MTAPLCPLCGTNDTSEPIDICGGCHSRLQCSGAIAVAATGEFAAIGPEQAASILNGDVEPDQTSGADARCTWCGRSQAQLRKLLSRGAAHICNECVALCADIMHAGLGDSWNR